MSPLIAIGVLYLVHLYNKKQHLSKLPILRYPAHNVCTIWPLSTTNDILLRTMSHFATCWSQMTIDPYQKQQISCIQCGASPNKVWKLNFLMYCVYKVYKWPLNFIRNNWVFYSICYTYTLNIRQIQASNPSLPDILCSQHCHNVTPIDPKWLLSSSKDDTICILNVKHRNQISNQSKLPSSLRYCIYKDSTIWPLFNPTDLYTPP